MSKYGLLFRIEPQQKQPARPPAPKVHGFNDDGDDDNVEREILRQAYRNKTHKDVEEKHTKALQEDPLAFDYDGVYDQMKEKQVLPKEQDRQDRKPKYIQKLIEKAKQREREHEIVYERKLAKERSQDDHLYANKDKFITSAYKMKLAEQAKWMEEERRRELLEEKEDVIKKTDLSDFYFNISKNVAFGAKDVGKGKQRRPEDGVIQPQQDDIPGNLSPKEKRGSNKGSEAWSQNFSEDAAASAAKDHHKRSRDAIAAAKERFSARKNAKLLKS